MILQRLLATTTLFLGLVSPAMAQPDLIVHHGNIVTVDEKFSIVEAMAVRGDRIQAVGPSDEILKLAGPQTKLVDLELRTVIPGLCDSHVHSPDASMYEFDHRIPEMETVADVLQHISSRAKQLPEGEWIIVRQVFITRLRDQRYPTRQELDAAAPKHPVVFITNPDCVCNSAALQVSGIDKSYQITDGKAGQIEKDTVTGEPTGVLRNALRLVKFRTPDKAATAEDRIRQLKELFADYNSVGLTSVADRYATESSIATYLELKQRGELSCRVFLSYGLRPNGTQNEILSDIDTAAHHPLHKYDSQLWLRGVKAYLDGGMLTGSAFLRQPWGVSSVYSITDPEYRGIRFIPQERLVELARHALKNGLQFTAHSVGDGAIHALIDAYAQINQEFPVRSHRPCITHCNFLDREAIEQMRDLGVVADLQPAWLWLDGATLEKHFGVERLAYFQPYKTLFDQGVIVGGGSDHMQRIGSLRAVNPYNPFLGMWIVMQRTPRRSDHALHPEQIITREHALRLYTINNAWLTFEEREKGSLEVGKLADFVVLNKDLLTCHLDEVRAITVNETWMGGKQVYRQP